MITESLAATFTLTFMMPEPAPRMMKNSPVGAGLPAIAAPAAEQTPIRGQGRSYRKPGIFLLFHANFHDAYRHTPNDEAAPVGWISAAPSADPTYRRRRSSIKRLRRRDGSFLDRGEQEGRHDELLAA